MSSQDKHNAQTVEVDGVPRFGTAQVGAELRAVRERVGWKLSEVAAELRIREPYLDAIERGDLAALPGPAYQIGFVRTYAQALGLDGEEILRRFRAEGAGSVSKPELSFLAPVPDRAVPTGAIVLVGVVVLLVGYGLWFLHTENERSLAASIPSVPAQLAPLAVPPAPPSPAVVKPPAPVMAQTTFQKTPPAPVPASSAASAPMVAGAPAPTQAGQVAATTASQSPGTPAAQNPGAPSQALNAVPTTAMPTTAATKATAGKVIMATADSWVEVKDATGNILFSKLMHSGDSWPVPDMPGLTMTSGNAGGTEIADNGTVGAPLGAAGAVVHNYALTTPAVAATASTPASTPAAAGPGPTAATPAPPGPIAPESTNSSPAKGPN